MVYQVNIVYSPQPQYIYKDVSQFVCENPELSQGFFRDSSTGQALQ